MFEEDRVNHAQINVHATSTTSSGSRAYFNFRQEVSVAAIWWCNASVRFFVGALRLCKRLLRERKGRKERERDTYTPSVSLLPPPLSLSLCVCEVRDCRSRRKCPLATIGAREGASAESARLKAGPLQRPAAPFQRTLPTNTLCLARAPS